MSKGGTENMGQACVRAALLGTVVVFASAAVGQEYPQAPFDADWIMNSDGEESLLVVTEPAPLPQGLVGSGAPPPKNKGKTVEGIGDQARPNVLSITNENGFTKITTQHIADYAVTYSDGIKAELVARPKFSSDFPDGVKAKLGDTIVFGQDIGYSGDTCSVGEGRGYWPPATFCSDANIAEIYLPNRPQPAEKACYTGLGQVGIFLNGVILFNWSDAQSYEKADVWHNAAYTFEQYDFDVCHGHAAGGVYHHHGYSGCLAKTIKDTGSGHSPVWGYSADGYPIHGPWQGEGQRARSCWFKRDYSADSPTGCGADNKRTCQLLDSEDVGQGTSDVSAAPDVGTHTESLFSKNPIVLDSGAYFEDYYYDPVCTTKIADGLDSHNGHDHDGLGYHFHLTVDDNMMPVFPYSFGPIYKGKLFDNAMTRCAGKRFKSASHGDRPDVDTAWIPVDVRMLAERF